MIRTPAPFTPAAAPRTPAPTQAAPVEVLPDKPEEHAVGDTLGEALEAAVELAELQSVKNEELDQAIMESAAERLTLFPVELVAAGVVQIESSSGSDSSSSSHESDSPSSLPTRALKMCHLARTSTSTARAA